MANDRLARLLFIVPYVASKDGVPLRELAQKLGVSTAQIEADLDLLSMVGQPPLTPDHLIDIYVEDEIVYVDLDQSLSRPPQLTQEEARALVLGAKLVGARGPLGEALDKVLAKIVAALNPVDREMVNALAERIVAHPDEEAGQAADLLRQACEERREVKVDYYSASSDALKSYRLRPLVLLTHAGVDYLVALDTGAELHEKLFRLDRMGDLRLLPETFPPVADIDLEKYRTDKLYFGRSTLTAEVRFAKEVAPLVAERFPEKERWYDDAGTLRVALSTSSPAWLARWALGFGEAAEVLGPGEARAAIGRLCREAAAAYTRDED